jgi:hypothetical protein
MSQQKFECRLQTTHHWFEQAVPRPAAKNQCVQLGVHFEEVSELLDVIESHDPITHGLIVDARKSMHELATRLKQNHSDEFPLYVTDYVMFLDALCDQIVTATGTAYMYGLNILGGMVEVNASNFSKFVDGSPVFNEHGKIVKGPDYFQADLRAFI